MEAAGECLGLAAIDLVVEEQGEELDVAEALVLGLRAPHLQGLEHASQAQSLEVGLKFVGSHVVTSWRSAC